MLGGTTFGAYFANIIRIRHHFKNLFAAVAAFIIAFIARSIKRKDSPEKGEKEDEA